VVARMLRRIEKKNEGILGEDQFGFRRGKGTGDAIEMLRIIPERTLDRDGELCACFIDWQNAHGRINADPKEHCHWLAQKLIYQQTVFGSECYSATGQCEDKELEHVLFVTDSIQISQLVPY
jgi:hypothetical protein